MNKPRLYRGHWPKNVSKTAKYSVRHVDGASRVTVMYDLGKSERVLAVDGGAENIVDMVGAVKERVTGRRDGVFYINEYRHLVVPDNLGNYYFAGAAGDVDFSFEYEGKRLTAKPVNLHGEMLIPGDEWVGPRPGIPYVLKPSGSDIHYVSPALTEDDPPQVRKKVKRTILLSDVSANTKTARDIARLVLAQRDPRGGRFYVNEHLAIFTPLTSEDGINYIYCGQIDLAAWFPEPQQDAMSLGGTGNIP